MIENNRNTEEINVEKLEQYIATLQKLSQSAKTQNNQEAQDALDYAVKLMQDKRERGDSPKKAGDELPLSSLSASDQLLRMAQNVRENTTTPADKTRAAAHLAHLAGHR